VRFSFVAYPEQAWDATSKFGTTDVRYLASLDIFSGLVAPYTQRCDRDSHSWGTAAPASNVALRLGLRNGRDQCCSLEITTALDPDGERALLDERPIDLLAVDRVHDDFVPIGESPSLSRMDSR
jgi:hypothetical protein